MTMAKTNAQMAAAIVTLCIAATSATAHVVVEPKIAARGPFKAVFTVPHGCSGSPTTSLRIVVPEGVIGVKPMPKSGWTLDTRRGAYTRTYDYFHGSKLSEGVREVEWSGGALRDDHVDEFVVIGFVSDAYKSGDTIHFAATQTCGAVSVNWTEIPAPGVDPHALKTPAPAITVGAR